MTMPKNPDKDTIFPTSVALMWAKMFCGLYKRGVRSARLADDEGLCRQYLDDTAHTGVWGEIGDRRLSNNVIDWLVTLTAVARDLKCYAKMQRYFVNMGRYGSNYFSAALNVALDWERLGVEEYLRYGSRCDLNVFDGLQRPRLTEKGIIRLDNGRIQDITQQLIRDRITTDNESGDKLALQERHYNTFRIRISQLSSSRVKEYFG